MDIPTALRLLEQESAELDAVLADLTPRLFELATPSPGWTIADQVAHLLWTDIVAAQTLRKDPAFDELRERIASRPGANLVDDEAHRLAAQPPAQLLEAWRDGREQLHAELAGANPAAVIDWFGPPMRPVTMATARIMETWAHSLDVFDALGLAKPAGPALAAVARIGVRTRGFSFVSHGLEAPDAEVRVELSLAEGEPLVFGPETADDRVVGTAWGFAAVVTQRRHRDDVELSASGPIADRWLDIAQAFAGAPTSGPRAGQRVVGGRR